MIKRLALILFLFALPCSAQHVVGCIGDSITNGYGTSPTVDPCTDAAAALSVFTGNAYTTVNEGINSATTTLWVSGSTYLNNAITAFNGASVNYVLIMLGTNDAIASTSQATYQANLQSTITALKAAGYNKIMLSYSPYDLGHVGSNTYLVQYQSAIQTLASLDNTHVFVGDTRAYALWNANTWMLQGDGVHPTNYGVPVMGQLWAWAFEADFLSVASCSAALNDGFHRANGAIGANWTADLNLIWSITSNAAYAQTAGAYSVNHWSANSVTAAQCAMVVGNGSANSGQDWGPSVNIQGGSGNGYVCLGDHVNGVFLQKITGGAGSNLAMTATNVSSTGSLVLQNDGSGHLTCTGLIDNIKLTATDTTYTGGSSGISGYNNTTTGISLWLGGNVAAYTPPAALTCAVGGFTYYCDVYRGATKTAIACNGGGSQVVGTVGYFHAELIGTQWWMCDPANNPWFENSVYVTDNTDLTGGSGTNFNNAIASKYGGGGITAWANNTTLRMTQAGFNAIGPYAGLGTHNMYPIGSFSSAANTTALPFIYHTDMSSDCINATGYTVLNAYYGQGYTFPDVFSPSMQTCYTADLTATGTFFSGGNNSRMGVFTTPFTDANTQLEAIWLGDTDFLMGLVASPSTPDHGAGIHLGYGFAVGNPTLNTHQFYGKSEWIAWVQGTAESQTSVSVTRSGSTITIALSDSYFGPNDILTLSSCGNSSFNSVAGTGVQVLTAGANLTATLAGAGASTTCTVSAGPGYASISAFNAAWGSTYTTFGSSGGGWGVGTGLNDENGSSAWFPQFSNSTAGGLSGGNAASRNDLQNFMQRICNKYFQVGRDSIRSVFPSHLVTGPGFLSTKTYNQVIISSLHYVDLPEMWMEPKWASTSSYLANGYNLSSVKKPIVLWSNLSASGESASLPNSFDSAAPTDAMSCNITGGVTNYDYNSQNLRGQCYYQLVRSYLNTVGSDGNHFVVGVRWWQLTDNYGEGVNYGIIDQFDNLYNATCPVTASVPSGDNGFACGSDASNYNSDFLGTVGVTGVGTKSVAANVLWIIAAQPLPAAYPTLYRGFLP